MGIVKSVEELKAISGENRYLFPSIKENDKPITDVALLSDLRSMGYEKHEICVHGFRGMASTILNKQGYNRDWIERQLAHNERDGAREAYNYAQYLPERRRVMQTYSDYLSELKEKAGL